MNYIMAPIERVFGQLILTYIISIHERSGGSAVVLPLSQVGDTKTCIKNRLE